MNRTLPHIGATLTGSRALSHYTQLAEQARLERERADEIDAALQVDALIDRVRLSPQFVATPDEPDAPLLHDVSRFAAALIVLVGFGLILREPVRHLLVAVGVLS